MNSPGKHHWWPQAFQRPWANDTGVVTRFIRDKNGRLVSKKLGPKGIGYERNLYSMTWDNFADPQFIETTFFASVIDDPAAKTLAKLIDGKVDELTTEDRSTLAGFLCLSHFRRADILKPAQDKLEKASREILTAAADSDEVYLKNHRPGESKKEFITRYAALQRDILLKDVLKLAVQLPTKERSYFSRIQELCWKVVDVSVSDLALLSSDKPYTLAIGFSDTDNVIMPISPNKIFLAEPKSGLSIIDGFTRANARKMVSNLNTHVCQGAKSFIITPSCTPDSALFKFVDKHFKRGT